MHELRDERPKGLIMKTNALDKRLLVSSVKFDGHPGPGQSSLLFNLFLSFENKLESGFSFFPVSPLDVLVSDFDEELKAPDGLEGVSVGGTF